MLTDFINNRINRLFIRLRITELLRVYGKKPKSWLDLGCGDGLLVNVCLSYGIDCVGIDRRPNNNSHVRQNDLDTYSTRNTYEIISFYHVLEHLHDPMKMLKKVRPWLSSGGIIIIEVPVIDNLTERLLRKKYFAYNDPTHQHLKSQQWWQQTIGAAGLKIITRGQTWHQFPFTVITTSLRQNVFSVLRGFALWFPYKVLSVLGFNVEIARFYCTFS